MMELKWFIAGISGAVIAYIAAAISWRSRGFHAGMIQERTEWHKLMVASGLGRYVPDPEFVTSGQYHFGHHTGYAKQSDGEPAMHTFVCDLWEDEHTTVGLKDQKKPKPPKTFTLPQDEDQRTPRNANAGIDSGIYG